MSQTKKRVLCFPEKINSSSRRNGLSKLIVIGICTLIFWCLQNFQLSAFAETFRVEIFSDRFVPETVTIQAGDIVEWFNRDVFPHTVTSTDSARTLNSGLIQVNNLFGHKFPEQPNDSEISYFCAVRPNGAPGRVIVRGTNSTKSAPTSTPALPYA